MFIAAAPLGVIAALFVSDIIMLIAPPQRVRAEERLRIGLFIVVLSAVAVKLIVLQDHKPLDLPGARFIRVEEGQGATLRAVVARLSRCRNAYSLPSLMSLHIWAANPPLTGLNINHPLAFLTDSQQEQVVSALDAAPGLCLLHDPALMEFFDRGQMAQRPPLLRFLEERLVPVERIGPYVVYEKPDGPEALPSPSAATP
ncbi:hypothetical protein GWK16_12340 [Roseomonas sp. JC162]|uniref:Uncharacterized protein n=1 Tax=Neoroseomonas marina TaxID=1232220 RepID=A0A848EF86_9PROT|nr:hypothetical protein [Neoroseomonas marina]